MQKLIGRNSLLLTNVLEGEQTQNVRSDQGMWLFGSCFSLNWKMIVFRKLEMALCGDQEVLLKNVSYRNHEIMKFFTNLQETCYFWVQNTALGWIMWLHWVFCRMMEIYLQEYQIHQKYSQCLKKLVRWFFSVRILTRFINYHSCLVMICWSWKYLFFWIVCLIVSL